MKHKERMTDGLRVLRRAAIIFVVTVFAFAVVAELYTPVKAGATQVSSRSILLSDSAPSGTSITTGVGSGTAVTYRVTFTTFAVAQSLVIDFCSNDPVLQDSCTAPTGLSISSAALASVSGGGNIQNPGWNLTTTASQVKLAKGSGSAATVGTQQFDLTGITNPSTVGTFYARLYTYSDNTYGSTSTAYSSPTVIGNYVDYGGFAMSTARVISITARVQETLVFCVSGANPTTWTTNHDCSDTQAATSPALILGHGSPTAILDNSAVDTGTVYSEVSTNATHGISIAMRNSNTSCGGLSADNGATCAIPAVGTPAAGITAGTAAFGMFAATPTLGTNGVGTVSVSGKYHNNSHATFPTDVWYGMDNVTSGNNVTTTFGDPVATSTGAVYHIDQAYDFAATASLTTPAGVYTANMVMIATGTF